jgi:hypothetical protein
MSDDYGYDGSAFKEMSEKAAEHGWLLVPPDAVLEFHPERHRALLRTDIAEIGTDLREWEWEEEHDCELAALDKENE